jgi:hypothetical protein
MKTLLTQAEWNRLGYGIQSDAIPEERTIHHKARHAGWHAEEESFQRSRRATSRCRLYTREQVYPYKRTLEREQQQHTRSKKGHAAA